MLYRHDRIEAQARLLGDTCFVMQDYDAALSAYKLVRVRATSGRWNVAGGKGGGFRYI